jgi:hypothetical protein
VLALVKRFQLTLLPQQSRSKTNLFNNNTRPFPEWKV